MRLASNKENNEIPEGHASQEAKNTSAHRSETNWFCAQIELVLQRTINPPHDSYFSSEKESLYGLALSSTEAENIVGASCKLKSMWLAQLLMLYLMHISLFWKTTKDVSR